MQTEEIIITIEEVQPQTIDIEFAMNYGEDPNLIPSLDKLNGEVVGISSSTKVTEAIKSKEAIKEAVNSQGEYIDTETPFSDYASIILRMLEDLKEGMIMTVSDTPNMTLVNNSVVKYTPNADDVITFDVSALDSGKCSTMELWLTLGEVVSFSIAGVTWVEEPSFDSANTLYALVIRWDGEKLIGNVAYSLEVTE